MPPIGVQQRLLLLPSSTPVCVQQRSLSVPGSVSLWPVSQLVKSSVAAKNLSGLGGILSHSTLLNSVQFCPVPEPSAPLRSVLRCPIRFKSGDRT